MSTNGRRKHSSQLKAQVATAAIRENKTINEIASQHGIHPSRISLWKKIALERLHEVFENGNLEADGKEKLIERLYQQVGKLQVEIDWIKKKGGNYFD